MREQPANAAVVLHDEVVELLDYLQGARRRLTDIQREFAALDVTRLDVDDLGEPATAAAEVQAAREGLRDVDRVLAMAPDAIYAVMRHTSRLRGTR